MVFYVHLMGFSGIFDWSAQLRDLTDILLLANVEGFDRDSVLRDTGQIPLLNTLPAQLTGNFRIINRKNTGVKYSLTA